RLYFGDSSYFEDKVVEIVSQFTELRYLVVDAGGINQIDATGEQILRDLVERLRDIGVDVHFTRAKKQLRDVLERTGCMDYIGRDHFHRRNQHAMNELSNRLNLASGRRE
ncbi:MAG: sodium-independent anion transporter, partial [Candidatus Latescibacteria bacterium]|nr:sodium-independent anion transporter [Candidatus Latescibacterota bacterium]